ncbi:ABC transporter permease [Ponticoccus sp. SC2-23]|uniref:ABC transporter permease n=1 Tax=Alexandriicola marinus TaxID=2081710 RepID=UPI000FD825A3|nr:ABC transporter permease [Alexandriicola marinus]MBM1219812.1 ABC transporter permease [Ponticoccus sp. SC6-9]MBM1223116.1 ABC transporter permease [Ponticoccus sp. SC6-15]MBM1229625.1 ABC transporter permease [Ponticoccus sp. SC6-38]MBM1232082.1 ABC transporter permease [Ponticoccus sp. SC6-45]MBM1237968.1 ABC transporter permease [Ponticoccus sp. SC6-49]MBM1241093.1 ABC transporter permease [Ponticoccus sp. SC2-64]MBM1245606.1 ABC transporter permease [Ponticoccus sp. SC6-42]MBM1250084
MTAPDIGLEERRQKAQSGSAPLIDADEQRRARRRRNEEIAKYAIPIAVMTLAIWYWDRLVVWNEIEPYILPRPGLVLSTLIEDWGTLSQSLLVTLQITGFALAVAVVGGVGLAVIFSLSRFAEMSFSPFAVILQVTPIVSIAPLIFIYIESRMVGLLMCAWIVAFFPILANTTLGLKSADHNLRDLFTIYRANRWQRLVHLQLPSALPYFLGGLKIAGGLALIGAVVAEYVAGTGGIGSGLAFRILEAGYRLQIPRMFAALILIAITGVIIYATTSLIAHLALRKWHESALKRE